MKFYSAIEYLCVDIANHFGLDKMLFEERIQWVKDNNHNLENLTHQADVKPLYHKAVMTLRAVMAGSPVGHPVALDAVCSGLQIMSCLTGCYKGAYITGLIDPNVRSDAYSAVTEAMNKQPDISISIPRSKAKQAIMTAFYGSKAQPKIIFGDETPELEAFFKTMGEEAPGAWTLLHELLDSWNPGALEHSWTLPDGYDVRVKVMQKVSKRIEVDELAHSTFTYEFEVNEGTEKGKSNAANVVHSVDAYVLRTMQRKCNYNKETLKAAKDTITYELTYRSPNWKPIGIQHPAESRYQQFKMADLSTLDTAWTSDLENFSTEHLTHLKRLIIDCLQHEPFELITVHDAFAAQAANCNWVRYHYKETLADLADSEILTVILNKLYKANGTYQKLSNNLSDYIRKSNYGLS